MDIVIENPLHIVTKMGFSFLLNLLHTKIDPINIDLTIVFNYMTIEDIRELIKIIDNVAVEQITKIHKFLLGCDLRSFKYYNEEKHKLFGKPPLLIIIILSPNL